MRWTRRLAAHGLSADDIVIRMTGCPNGCARPYLAEIGLVGKGPGRYNLYLGAAFDGSRLSKLYAEDVDHAGIVAALDPIFAAYAAERQKGERFGDFCIRAGFVAATGNGRDFHANTGAQARHDRRSRKPLEARHAAHARLGAAAGVPRAGGQARGAGRRQCRGGLEGGTVVGRRRARRCLCRRRFRRDACRSRSELPRGIVVHPRMDAGRFARRGHRRRRLRR